MSSKGSKKSKKGQSNFYFGTDSFQLENGDIYVGGYCAHKTGIVWREGPGVYITKDNQVYEGLWENDKLNGEDVKINYQSSAEFYGSFLNGRYNGLGTYKFKNSMVVECNYDKNVPVKEMKLTDPHGYVWRGQAELPETLLLPDNHFYDNLTYEKGLGDVKPRKIRDSEIAVGSKSLLNFQKIFMAFGRRKRTKQKKSKLMTDVISDDDSLDLPLNFKKLSILTTLKPDLYDIFKSPAYRNYCKPINVIYPTCENSQKPLPTNDEK